MSKIYEVGFKLSAKMASNFSASFAKAGGAVGGLSDKLSDLNRQSADVSALVKGRRAVGESARAYIAAKQKVADLGRAMSATERPTADMVREFKAAKHAMDRAKLSLDKERESLRSLESATGMTGSSLKTLTQRQKDLALATDAARQAQEKQARIRGKIDATVAAREKISGMRGNAIGSLATIGAGVAATAGAPVAQALAQEDQKAELRKFSDDYEQVFAGIQQLSLTYAKSTEDMVAMASNAFQSGIAKTGAEALKLVEIQNQMAIAFDMSGDQVGAAYADIQSKMGLTIDQSKELFDVVNQLGNTTSAGSADIVEVLTRAGGAVRGLTAMTGNQTAALAGAFRSAAVSSETASTSMMTFINALSAGEGATKSQRDGLAALGVDAVKVGKMMVAGPEQAERAMRDVLSRIGQLSDDKKSSIIGSIFGNEAGVKSAVATLAKQTEMLEGNFKLLGDKAAYAGSMTKEYKARADTTSNSIDLAKNASVALAAGLGKTLTPAVRQAADSFVAQSKVLMSWIDSNQELISTVAKVTGTVICMVASFHAAKLAFTLVAGPILAVRKAVLLAQSAYLAYNGTAILATARTKALAAAQVVASGAMKAVALATKAFNLVLAGNPIALTVMAIGGLIAAGVALYRNWDAVKARMTALWASFTAMADGLKTGFLAKWNSVWTSARDIFANAFSSLTAIASTPINAVIAMINGVIRSINAVQVKIPDWVPGMGGKTFSANISEIPSIGGVAASNAPQSSESGASKPSFATASAAVAGTARPEKASAGTQTMTFAPVINVKSDGTTTREELATLLRDERENFRVQMERFMRDRQRRSYE